MACSILHPFSHLLPDINLVLQERMQTAQFCNTMEVLLSQYKKCIITYSINYAS